MAEHHLAVLMLYVLIQSQTRPALVIYEIACRSQSWLCTNQPRFFRAWRGVHERLAAAGTSSPRGIVPGNLLATSQVRVAMNWSSITAGRGVLLSFILFYAALFSAFGCFSPFLPAFLTERGLKPEQLGVVLGAATVVRLVCGPLAGRLADRFHFLRAQLAVCAVLGAGAALLYLAAQGFWTIMAVSLLQAAALAPLVPLADALSLAHARPRPNKQIFEYGWVRG